MPDVSDIELLREYEQRSSEEAFSELVQRHVNLVYSVALRHVRIAAQAEEITQAVFVILARKAGSLRPNVVLEGWLHETTRLTSLSFMRGERRRQFREQEAYMQSTLQETPDDSVWNRLAPLLDEGMAQLGTKDRDAMMLRFFKGKSVREVARALNVNEEAAQKRVLRAMEKLRKFFTKRGVNSTTSIIAGVISTHSIQSAPVALAKSVIVVAAAKGAAASSSTLILVKGALKVMAWTKMKTAAVASIGIFLAIAGGTAFYEAHRNFENAAGGPADMKIKWMVGKKYALHIGLTQSAETRSPNQQQPAKDGLKWTQDITVSALTELPDGGRHLELEWVGEAMNESHNGRNVLSFDSTRSSAVNARNRLAILGAIIGRRLGYSIDVDGNVQKVEGADELMAHIAAVGTPQQQEFFKGAFGGDALKYYLAIGEMMPNRMIHVGESWSVTKDTTDPSGTVTTTKLTYTFKNWEQHGGRRCVRIEKTGDLSTKSVSTTSGVAVEIMKGTYSGELWFDPELGMVVGSNEDQDLTLKITTRTQTLTKQTHNNSQMALVDVQ